MMINKSLKVWIILFLRPFNELYFFILIHHIYLLLVIKIYFNDIYCIYMYSIEIIKILHCINVCKLKMCVYIYIYIYIYSLLQYTSDTFLKNRVVKAAEFETRIFQF